MEGEKTVPGSSIAKDFFLGEEEKPGDSFFPSATSTRNGQNNIVAFDNEMEENGFHLDSFRFQRFMFDKEEREKKYKRNDNPFTFTSEELLWDMDVDSDFHTHKTVHVIDLKDVVKVPLSPFPGKKSTEGHQFLSTNINESDSSIPSWYHVKDIGGMNVIANTRDQQEEIVAVHESSSRDTQCDEDYVEVFEPVDHVTELLKIGSERLKARKHCRR